MCFCYLQSFIFIHQPNQNNQSKKLKYNVYNFLSCILYIDMFSFVFNYILFRFLLLSHFKLVDCSKLFRFSFLSISMPVKIALSFFSLSDLNFTLKSN